MILYIDPGTGSMLFTVIISVLGFLAYISRVFLVKAKYLFTRGKVDKTASKKIPVLIFAESKRYWNVFGPICRELEKKNINVVYWTTSEDDPVFDQKICSNIKPEFIGKGNKAFAKLNMVNARIVLATTPGLDVYQWKRSKLADYYVHIPHGPNGVAGYRMFGIDFYDSILLSGEYQIDELRELENKRNLPHKEVEIVGVPYMDELRGKIADASSEPHNGVNVLLAPSWGDSSIFNKFGTEIMEELVKTGYHIIVRPHPQTFISDPEMIEKIMKEYPESDQIHWDRSGDNFDSLNSADILISDFSGVIFDFALAFDKPLLYADVEFNSDCYDFYWLSENPWTFEVLPKLGLELKKDDLGNLKSMIDRCLTEDRFKEGRKTAIEQTWANVGDGAVYVADYIARKNKELSSAKSA